MRNEKTMAYINLFSVLRNIEDLCRIDEYSKNLINGLDISIGFIVKGGPKATLVFKNNKCRFIANKAKARIVLYFTSYKHFNNMVEGKANPIPVKGLLQIGFLTGDFIKLTERLEYFLRPEPAILNDEDFKLKHTELLLYTAAFALTEYGNMDPIGKKIAHAIPDGVISMEVKDGICVNITSLNDKLETQKGAAETPRARVDFADMEAAFKLLSGESDSYTCIALEQLHQSGFLPMLDNMDKLLFHVSSYLR